MEANRDESERCLAVSKKAYMIYKQNENNTGQLEKAYRLAEKANRMYPSEEVTKFLEDLKAGCRTKKNDIHSKRSKNTSSTSKQHCQNGSTGLPSMREGMIYK